jgi:hypothetical protein
MALEMGGSVDELNPYGHKVVYHDMVVDRLAGDVDYFSDEEYINSHQFLATFLVQDSIVISPAE